MGKAHLSNGEVCRCDMVFSDHPRKYVKNHPNKEPNFNDEIAAAIAHSNANRTTL